LDCETLFPSEPDWRIVVLSTSEGQESFHRRNRCNGNLKTFLRFTSASRQVSLGDLPDYNVKRSLGFSEKPGETNHDWIDE